MSPSQYQVPALSTGDARRTWQDLTLGRKREVLRHLITVTLPRPGRGHVFTGDLVQAGPSATPPDQAARGFLPSGACLPDQGTRPAS